MSSAVDPGADPAGERELAPGEMSLFEHLAELRQRLVKVVLALVVGGAVGFALFDTILDVLIAPYCDVPSELRRLPGRCTLVATRALEPFSVRVKVSLVFGAFVTGPVIFYQLWRFVTPGLTSRERRLSLPFVVGSQLMFAGGMAFAYLIIPKGLRILIDMGGENIEALLTAGEYITFLLTTAVAFGLVFELPLLLIFLSLIGVVTSRSLRNFRPYALVINTLVAALITPTTDAVTLLFMAVPMSLFYELAIVVSWLIERRRRRRTVGA